MKQRLIKELCPFFANGYCKYESECWFLHEENYKSQSQPITPTDKKFVQFVIIFD
jgi:hypothetical protein